MIDAAEQARLMAVKAGMVQTTNTPGWHYIKQLADNIVTKTINEAFDEDDRDKRDSKTLKAAALRKGFAELFQAVEATKSLTFEPDTDEAGLGELEVAPEPIDVN
jgi:hypothetical protein